jgi:hypothetical protein
MQRIINYLSKFIVKDAVKPLGRWGAEKCNIKLAKKIDLANEDHCGPCGQYAQSRTLVSISKVVLNRTNPTTK